MNEKINNLKNQIDDENKKIYELKIKEKFGGYLEKSKRLNNTLKLSNIF
jgi:hypothetical protein